MTDTKVYTITNADRFAPHITMRYVDPDNPPPLPVLDGPIALPVNRISLVVGDERQDFDLGAPDGSHKMAFKGDVAGHDFHGNQWTGGQGGGGTAPSWSPTMTQAQADVWAKDSAIQAPQYHGTSGANVETLLAHGFDSSLIGVSIRANQGLFGRGFYFTSSKAEGERYAGAGYVIETKVNVTNPMPASELTTVMSSPEFRTAQIGQGRDLAATAGFLQDYATSHGYDAIQGGSASRPELVVFDPHNVTIVSSRRTW